MSDINTINISEKRVSYTFGDRYISRDRDIIIDSKNRLLYSEDNNWYKICSLDEIINTLPYKTSQNLIMEFVILQEAFSESYDRKREAWEVHKDENGYYIPVKYLDNIRIDNKKELNFVDEEDYQIYVESIENPDEFIIDSLQDSDEERRGIIETIRRKTMNIL